jgi:alpha-glucosidase
MPLLHPWCAHENAHGQEILVRPQTLLWRTLCGPVHLKLVTRNHQLSTVGLPAMFKYSMFGFHRCRWGYKNLSEVENVVGSFEKFGIPQKC